MCFLGEKDHIVGIACLFPVQDGLVRVHCLTDAGQRTCACPAVGEDLKRNSAVSHQIGGVDADRDRSLTL